ncbi:hypothetical protein XENOCAPTIV_026732 [Xenoophorus captivus]|uniref:Uncharacterized protein n=1 Tax=Xenoophorus captivus TaxID=1517983 RepID=A0ABV0QWT1_9TELE
MAAAVEAPVPAEQDSALCGSEGETRGAEVEEKSQPQTGSTGPAVPHSRLSKLPLARIKALMKTDPDVSLASQESARLIRDSFKRPVSRCHFIHHSTTVLCRSSC